MYPGPSASIAGNKLSVRTTAEELNRRKATVYIHPIFAPCCLDIQPGVRVGLRLGQPPVVRSRVIRRFCVLGPKHFERASNQRVDTVFNIGLLVE